MIPADERAPHGPCDSIALAEELLARGCRVRLRVTGGSMSPWLESGAVVTLRPAEPAGLLPGDIVLARLPGGGRVMHRLVGRRDADEGPRFLLKGDAMRLPDGLFDARDLSGKVVAVDRDAAPAVCLETPARRLVGLALALASRAAPRLFARASHALAGAPRRGGHGR